MYKKEKNIINPADAVNLTGSTEADLKAGPAGDSADFKTTGNCSPLATGGKSGIKTGGSYSALSGKLHLLILIGLSVAVLLLLAGFGLNFFNGARNLSLKSLQENTLSPTALIDAIENNQMPASLLAGYAGLIAMILVPAAGLIYILGYFTRRKKYNLALAAAGVLFILILSAVIGLLKS
jgi:hypothetical protein